MRHRRYNSAGFTLMEVVVAITLMSLIMMTLVMGLRLAANAWHRGEQKLDQHARTMAGADVMSEQVAAAAIHVVTEYRGLSKVPVDVVAFAGTPSEVRFCTRYSWRGDQSRPEFMADYRVVQDAQGRQQLVISEQGLTDDGSVIAGLEAPPATQGEAVADPADRIELAYFQPATATLPAQWVSVWQPITDSELPRAVRVTWVRGRDVQQETFPIAINHLAKRQ